MNVIGSKTKKKYTMDVGDNGRTFTDESGNSMSEDEFRKNEDDYTTERGNQNAAANETQWNRSGQSTAGGKKINAPSDVSTAPLADKEKKNKPVSENIMQMINPQAPVDEEKKKKRNLFLT